MASEGKTREVFVTFPDIIHSFYARAKTKMENYLCSNGKIRGRLTIGIVEFANIIYSDRGNLEKMEIVLENSF